MNGVKCAYSRAMANNHIFLSPPHMSGTELEFVRAAFDSNYIAPLGPMVDAFEKEFSEYTGISHCLALASGTAAMHLALRELGVANRDLVVASTLTFIGSVSPATFLGATPVFIDSDPHTWNMDPGLLAEELADCARRGKLPKAVIPTDLYGQCCDLPRITSICNRYQIPVVSDSAEAMGAFYCLATQRDAGTQGFKDPGTQPSALNSQPSGLSTSDKDVSAFRFPLSAFRHAGSGAKAAVFSFNGNKILNTSGGGMLASEDSQLIAHARKLSQQARDPAPHYEHTEIGYNYRMSNVLAAIGRGQLRVLDERVAAKRRIFEAYHRLLGNLPGVTFMPESPTGRSNRWLTVILIDPADFGANRDDVRLALEAENIESRPLWKPMHLQPVFQGCRVCGGSVSERLFTLGLCLPSGTAMTESDLERVASVVRSCHTIQGLTDLRT